MGIGLVLAAVFGPMAFFPGSTGVIYRQFSVTVIASMLLSVVVALILSPVLCASLLKPVAKGHEAAETGFRLLRPFFLWFDRCFYRLRDLYVRRGRAHPRQAPPLPRSSSWLIVAGLVVLFARMPTGYLPDEDQGMMLVIVQLPVRLHARADRGGDAPRSRPHFRENEKEAVESSHGASSAWASPAAGRTRP